MHRQLIKLVLVTSFGKAAKRPVYSSVFRLVIAWLTALSLGIVLSNGLKQLKLPHDLPDLLVLTTAMLFSFSIAGLILLSVNTVLLQNSSLNKIIALMPLKRRIRWLILLLPNLLAASVLVTFAIPISLTLAPAAGFNLWLCVLAVITGTLSATGFCLIRFTKWPSLRTVIYIILNILLFGLLEKSISTLSSKTRSTLLIAIILLILSCLAGYIQSYFKAKTLGLNKLDNLVGMRLKIPIINVAWFMAKIIRNRRAAGSLLFCAFVITSLIIMNHFKQASSFNSYGAIVFTGLIIGTFACDIRGLSRRYIPPEIISVRGVEKYIDKQLISTLAFGAALMLPVYIITAQSLAVNQVHLGLFSLALMVSAVSLGLLSSTIFTPRAGELGSQFFAAMLTTLLLVISPKIFKFSDQTILIQGLAWLCIAGLGYLLTLTIEQRRRANYGRA